MSETNMPEAGASTASTTPAGTVPETKQPDTFKVTVFDLVTHDLYEYPMPDLNAAVNHYKYLVQLESNRSPRPFISRDDALWFSLVKYNGGIARQIWVSDNEKVRGHNAGIRKQEAEKAGFGAPPALKVPVKAGAAAQAKVAPKAEEPPPAEVDDADVPF